jgi:hypothetical protein
VKICSLYGDGFYYIPGTDVCLKIGGYVRAEWAYNYGASMTNGPFSGVNGFQTRTDGQDFTMRSRAYVWEDSRQQTEYGTLRTYFQLGVNYDNPQSAATNFTANRAFIQFAGFTVGLAQSFFDFFSAPASSYWANVFSGDTGDPGWKVFAYTAQFGNGVSSTVSVEEPRRSVIWNTDQKASGAVADSNGATLIVNPNFNTWAVGALPISNTIKTRFPDLVSNWRVDQAWGSAQIMFAAHDASGGYYAGLDGAAGTNAAASSCPPAGVGTITGSEVCGHPADKVGWAAGAGIKVNTWGGSYFQIQGTYAQGATRYVAFTPAGAFSPTQFKGATLGYGILSDGVFSTATGDVQLTTAFGVNAAYDHFWRPDLRTSLYGTWATFRYNAVANAAICLTQAANGQPGSGTIAFNGIAGASTTAACDNNFNWWAVGSRTQWNITPWFYVGFDVVYQKLETASNGALVNFTALTGGAKPGQGGGTTPIYSVTNQDNVAFRVRMHRDIIP